jgi:hypothetical protein
MSSSGFPSWCWLWVFCFWRTSTNHGRLGLPRIAARRRLVRALVAHIERRKNWRHRPRSSSHHFSISAHSGCGVRLCGRRLDGRRRSADQVVTAGSAVPDFSRMVGGVFVARWTLPTVLEGHHLCLSRDLREKPHLIIWALLAGDCGPWQTTLGTFAIRDVGSDRVSAVEYGQPDRTAVGLALFPRLTRCGLAVWTKVLGEAPRS